MGVFLLVRITVSQRDTLSPAHARAKINFKMLGVASLVVGGARCKMVVQYNEPANRDSYIFTIQLGLLQCHYR